MRTCARSLCGRGSSTRSGGSDEDSGETRGVPPPPVFEWAIEEILDCHPNLYLDYMAVMAVAVMARRSKSPCEFMVRCKGFTPPALEGAAEFVLRVTWSPQTEASARRVRRT